MSSESQRHSTRSKISVASLLISGCRKCSRQVSTPHSSIDGVDGGNFGIPDSLPGLHIGEVVEEAAMCNRLYPTENESARITRSCASAVCDVAALVADTERGQCKPGRSDTRHYPVVGSSNVAPIFHQTRLRVRLLYKKEEVRSFQLLQKLVVFRRDCFNPIGWMFRRFAGRNCCAQQSGGA